MRSGPSHHGEDIEALNVILRVKSVATIIVSLNTDFLSQLASGHIS